MFLGKWEEGRDAKAITWSDHVKAVCIYSNALLFTVWLLLHHERHSTVTDLMLILVFVLSRVQQIYCTFSTTV